MGPVEAGLILAAKQRQQRLGSRPPLKAFAWKPRIVPKKQVEIDPIDLARSPYGPPVPCIEPPVLRAKQQQEDEEQPATWRPQEKHIIEIVAGIFGVDTCGIISDRRHFEVLIPRHVAIYLSKKLTPHSLPRIGRAFGGRDHTTIISAVRRISRIIEAGEEKDLRLIAKIGEAENLIRDRFAVASDLNGDRG